ncbi:hypothetical protein B0H13DRAFT_2578456 [Mycena leptocephala]|nr:hypothetical protein B0H13DRAFT_2578456 [Mycena leptocephala]
MEAGSMSTSTDTIRTLHTRQTSPSPSPPDNPSLSASGSSVSSFPSVSSSFFFSSAAASPPHVPHYHWREKDSILCPHHSWMPSSFHTLVSPIFTEKYFISLNLRILGGEGLFIESGMHAHPFALNLVRKNPEGPYFTSHPLATGHHFAQRKTATRWLGWLLRKLSIIPELVLPAAHVVPRTPNLKAELKEEEEKVNGPTTRLLVLGPRTAAAAALCVDNSSGWVIEDDGLSVLRAESAWRGDKSRLVSLGEDLHQLSLPTTTHRILAPFYRIGALLAPPVLSSPDGEKEEKPLGGMLEGVGVPIYRALVVVLPRARTSVQVRSGEKGLPDQRYSGCSRNESLNGLIMPLDQSRSITSKSRLRAILANAAKPAYKLYKQNPGQCLRDGSVSQSLRTLRPELSKLRILGGINQQQCPYRGLCPRLNVTQILRLRLETKMINLVAATVRNSARHFLCLRLGLGFVRRGYKLTEIRTFYHCYVVVDLPPGREAPSGFGSGFDDSGFGRGFDDPGFGFKDRGSAFDERGSLFD